MKTSMMHRLSFLAVIALCLVSLPVFAQKQPSMPVYQALTQNSDWLNTSRALAPDDLKGRIILVDFWTYCCINCIHVIPKLHELEKEFGDKLTVIGVHSAKFAAEGETANIREAIQKYEIEHPVINDADFRVWNTFGVNAWPTLLLIDPNGHMTQVYRGEGDIDAMRRDIEKLIEKSSDKLVMAKLPLALEKDKIPPTLLQFPTKMNLKDDKTLVISDSGHHRIIVADIITKQVIATIGKGVQGFADGDLETAQFNSPQGVLSHGDIIYVADTGNHRLRQIDLKTKTVTTLAGTGERGGYTMFGKSNAIKTALASPWDLAFYPDKNTIAIANAGTHQLWSYDIAEKELSILAGNGQESIDDGKSPFNSLSQPSGLSVQGDKLYFVDSETSSLRVFEKGKVTTLIGTGLFDFGLKDGDRNDALMQHAIGVYADTDAVYIADTYNNAIRKYQDGKLSTLPIKGLKEPNAIIKVGKEFYIADTNHHRIVAMDESGKMTGVIDLMPAEKPPVFENTLPNALPDITKEIGEGVEVTFDLPKGWHINQLAPSYMALYDVDKNAVQTFKAETVKKGAFDISGLEAGKSYILQGILYYCEDVEGSQCLIRGVNVHLTASDKSDKIGIIEIPLPK